MQNQLSKISVCLQFYLISLIYHKYFVRTCRFFWTATFMHQTLGNRHICSFYDMRLPNTTTICKKHIKQVNIFRYFCWWILLLISWQFISNVKNFSLLLILISMFFIDDTIWQWQLRGTNICNQGNDQPSSCISSSGLAFPSHNSASSISYFFCLCWFQYLF